MEQTKSENVKDVKVMTPFGYGRVISRVKPGIPRVLCSFRPEDHTEEEWVRVGKGQMVVFKMVEFEDLVSLEDGMKLVINEKGIVEYGPE